MIVCSRAGAYDALEKFKLAEPVFEQVAQWRYPA